LVDGGARNVNIANEFTVREKATTQKQFIDKTATLLGVEKVLVAGRRWLCRIRSTGPTCNARGSWSPHCGLKFYAAIA
jgi:hypothetical protein